MKIQNSEMNDWSTKSISDSGCESYFVVVMLRIELERTVEMVLERLLGLEWLELERML